MRKPPLLSVIVLNWNRKTLLQRTVYSLLATGPSNFELFIVDNASSDGSREWISALAQVNARVRPIFLESNIGGEALNLVYPHCRGDFILISENDLEYRPGWHVELLAPFSVFEDLGQLSPLSPFPEPGEIWGIKPHIEKQIGGDFLCEALENVGTSCMVRRKLLDEGIRWLNIPSQNNTIKMPSDGDFSFAVRSRGYKVAWSRKPQVKNLGHAPAEWASEPEYYMGNWKTKSESGVDGICFDEQFTVGVLCQELEALKRRYKLIQHHVPDKEFLKKVGVLPEMTHLYIDRGNGFCSDTLIKGSIDPVEQTFNCEFDLTKFNDICGARWDPIEGNLCSVKISRVVAKKQSGELLQIPIHHLHFNEHDRTEGGWIQFRTTDPMVFIPLAERHCVRLSIQGTIEIAKPQS